MKPVTPSAARTSPGTGAGRPSPARSGWPAGPVLLLLLLLLAPGCAGPVEGPGSPAAATSSSTAAVDPGDGIGDQRPASDPADDGTRQEAPGTRAATRRPPLAEVAGHSLEDRPLPLIVLGQGPDTTLLLASIHGDEAAGTPLLERLAAELTADPGRLVGRRVVLLPVVNPDGLARDRRLNARSVDLNRNFPASNRRERHTSGDEPLSEPESRAVLAVVERYAPDRVVSIHGWVGQVDWDGPAAELARVMGEACDLPAQRLGSRPGSLGSHLGLDRGLPVITLELPWTARDAGPEELWRRFGPALLAALESAPTG